MKLNLGLEGLYCSNRSNCDTMSTEQMLCAVNDLHDIENEIHTLEATYDAIYNACIVRRAVRKYGAIEAIEALVGKENLALIASLEDETPNSEEESHDTSDPDQNPTAKEVNNTGVFAKVKKVLVTIWSKICEYWNRLLGVIFNYKKRLDNKVAGLKAKNEHYKAPIELTLYPKDSYKKFADDCTKAADDIKNAQSDETVVITKSERGTIKFNTTAEMADHGKALSDAMGVVIAKKDEITNTFKNSLDAAKNATEKDKEKINTLKKKSAMCNRVLMTAIKILNSEAARFCANTYGSAKQEEKPQENNTEDQKKTE